MKVFSFDETNYYDYDDIVEMMEDDGERDFIFIGDKTIQEHKNFLTVSCLFEDMQDRASELGEWSEGYLEEVTKEQKEELNNLVLDWFNKNVSKPPFFLIENVEKITLEQFKTLQA